MYLLNVLGLYDYFKLNYKNNKTKLIIIENHCYTNVPVFSPLQRKSKNDFYNASNRQNCLLETTLTPPPHDVDN